MLTDEEHASQVDVNCALPDLEGHPVDSVVLTCQLDGRIPDHDVEPLPCRHGDADGLLDLGFAGDVGDEHESRAPLAPHIRGCLVGSGTIDVDQGHLGPF